MPHMPFIVAAFSVTAVGMVWLTVSSFLAMRRSEALADDLRHKP